MKHPRSSTDDDAPAQLELFGKVEDAWVDSDDPTLDGLYLGIGKSETYIELLGREREADEAEFLPLSI